MTCVVIVAIAAWGMLAARAGAAEGPFESEIKAFEVKDQKQMPPRDAVLFIIWQIDQQ